MEPNGEVSAVTASPLGSKAYLFILLIGLRL